MVSAELGAILLLRYSPIGTRVGYDGSLPRLLQDRFDGSTDPYWFERNYAGFDGLGNVTTITGGSFPGDIDLDESFAYDTRNRIDEWTKGGTQYDYDYDPLGNLTVHAGDSQSFTHAGRPHAILDRATGSVVYDYDDDGNMKSIVEPGSSRYFTFDSANHLVCIDAAPAGACGVSRIHYDVDGRRVLEDQPPLMSYVAYVDDSFRVEQSLSTQSKIDVMAFGERIAYKTSNGQIRTSSLLPFAMPPIVPPLIR